MRKILFIDRDGTLIEEPEDQQVDAIEKVQLVPGVIAALQNLRDFGYEFVVVSNQDGLGTAAFPRVDFETCHEHMLSLFNSQGIFFDEEFICPHLPEDMCDCRKPRTGLLTKFLSSNQLDITACAVIGDRDTDLELADALGMRGIRLGRGEDNSTWEEVCAILKPGARIGAVNRATAETTVDVEVNLDSSSPVAISTGIGFFDHMLEQIAKHGGFSLQVACDGDLDVDEHHTVEDTALSIGKAMKSALGEKRGISRYGFQLPMDESEARVSLDISGRPFFVFDGEFTRESVGELPTELVPHFFLSLAESLGATLHISVTGENAHHMIEACFKAVGRTLRQAIRQEGSDMPSTKGMLE